MRSYDGLLAAILETRFVRSGTVDIAHQVVGEGDLDIVVVPGCISHCDVTGSWLSAPGSGSGCANSGGWWCSTSAGGAVGSSSPTAGVGGACRRPGRGARCGRLRARALAGWTDGAAAALLFAATYAERVSALVCGAVVARGRTDLAAGTQAIDPATVEQLAAMVESSWGQGLFLNMVAPSMAEDPRFVAWWRRLERWAVTSNAAGAIFRAMLQVDVRPCCPPCGCRRSCSTGATPRWSAPRGQYYRQVGQLLDRFAGSSGQVSVSPTAAATG